MKKQAVKLVPEERLAFTTAAAEAPAFYSMSH
jgi:hypothetical protein